MSWGPAMSGPTRQVAGGPANPCAAKAGRQNPREPGKGQASATAASTPCRSRNKVPTGFGWVCLDRLVSAQPAKTTPQQRAVEYMFPTALSPSYADIHHPLLLKPYHPVQSSQPARQPGSCPAGRAVHCESSVIVRGRRRPAGGTGMQFRCMLPLRTVESVQIAECVSASGSRFSACQTTLRRWQEVGSSPLSFQRPRFSSRPSLPGGRRTGSSLCSEVPSFARCGLIDRCIETSCIRAPAMAASMLLARNFLLVLH